MVSSASTLAVKGKFKDCTRRLLERLAFLAIDRQSDLIECKQWICGLALIKSRFLRLHSVKGRSCPRYALVSTLHSVAFSQMYGDLFVITIDMQLPFSSAFMPGGLQNIDYRASKVS